MSAIKKQSKNSTFVVAGVIALVAISLFAYLMWYVEPEENLESQDSSGH